MSTSQKNEFANDYSKFGFVTDIESEKGAKGLSEETIRFLSAKKNEPEWMTEWRLDALRRVRSKRHRFRGGAAPRSLSR